MSNLFPAGKFLTRCKEWAIGATKAEEPQVFLAFQDVEGVGQPPAYYGTFGEKALVHTMKALRACGYKGSDVINDLDTAHCGLDANMVEIVVEHEQYEGKWSAKLKWVNVPGAGVKTLAPDKKAAFAQTLKAKILALELGQPKPASQTDGPPPGHPAHHDTFGQGLP